MTIELDHFDVHQKQLYVIIATAVGLFLSHISTILRVWARLLNVKILGAEDWFMVTALLLRYGVAVPLCWGQCLPPRLCLVAQWLTENPRALNRSGAK